MASPVAFRSLSSIRDHEAETSVVAGDTPRVDPFKTHGQLSPSQEAAFVAVVCLSNVLVQAGSAQGLAPARLISEALGGNGSAGEVGWFAASYSLTAATFILVAGRLGDTYGYKKMTLLGLFWFGLWSFGAACGSFLDSTVFFTICRALQGVGPAFIQPNGLALIGHYYSPGRRKDMAFAFYGASAPIAFYIGSVVSSAFAQHTSWAWMFVAMGVSCWVLAAMFIPAVPTHIVVQHIPDENSRPPFDFKGAFLGVVGLVLMNIAWNQAPSEGWGQPYISILFVVGLIALVAFVYVERRVEEPLLPPDCLTADSAIVLAIIGLGWASFGVWLLYLWQFLEGLRGLSAVHASFQITPLGLVGVFAGVSTGFLLSHMRTSRILLIAVTCFTIGSLLLATAPVEQTYWGQTFIAMLVMPWAMDMSFPAGTVLLSNSLPKHYQGLAASLINTVVNYAMSIGLGIAGTAEYYVVRNGSSTLDGYRSAWFVGVALGGCGMLLALWGIHREHQRSKQMALPA